MDLQSLVNSFHLNAVESWYIYSAAVAILTFCVITYFFHRAVFRRRSAKSKRQKSQKKQSEDKKATHNSTTTNPVKPSVASTVTTPKVTKSTRKQTPATSEPVSKPEVQAVVSVKTVSKISDPQPKTDVSDTDEGPWIEVGKNKKDSRNIMDSRLNKMSGQEATTEADRSSDLVTQNQVSVKKREGGKKSKTPSGIGKSSGDLSARVNYKPIEEPTFSQPSKPKRRSNGLDEEEEEWQEVRFSRRSRKFTNKD